jgi:hypothetical protein
MSSLMLKSFAVLYRVVFAFFAIALFATFASGPSSANLFGIKHVEPSPLPEGQWNFTSAAFQPYTSPAFADVTAYAQCRYVAPKEPYEWLFTYKNLTGHAMTFDMGLIQTNNGRFATVAQIYTDVEPTSIKPVKIKPHGVVSILEEGRYGCPGMEGGVNKSKHYVVILDNVTEDGRLLRSGVFTAYDQEVNQAHREYSAAVAGAMAAGASAGFDMISNSVQSDQALGGVQE